MKGLIKEYKKALREINKAKRQTTDPCQRNILASCIDSLEFAIEYMETGRHPDNRRAITRRSDTQREIFMDPQNFAFIRMAAPQRTNVEANSNFQKAIDHLDIVLKRLSQKELEAYTHVRANGYSFGEAAQAMGIQKGTVQVLVKRAEIKIYDLVSDLTDKGITFKRPAEIALKRSESCQKAMPS